MERKTTELKDKIPRPQRQRRASIGTRNGKRIPPSDTEREGKRCKVDGCEEAWDVDAEPINVRCPKNNDNHKEEASKSNLDWQGVAQLIYSKGIDCDKRMRELQEGTKKAEKSAGKKYVEKIQALQKSLEEAGSEIRDLQEQIKDRDEKIMVYKRTFAAQRKALDDMKPMLD